MRPPKGKQKLFDAAMRLFETRGYFATSVEQITEEAGVSKGLVYNYFASKEDLLRGLLLDATSRMASVGEELVSGPSPKASLSKFVDQYIGLLRSERQLLKLQLTLMLTPELRDVVLEPQRERAALLLKMLVGWFTQAGASQPKSSAQALLAMLDGVALHYLCIYERYPLKSLKPLILQTASDLCRPPKRSERE